MADDAGVGDEPLNVGGTEGCDTGKVEAGKGGAEIVALPEDGQPRQAGLEALQADLLKQPDVVADRPPPFGVVIGEIVGQIAVPPAAPAAIGAFNQAVLRRHAAASPSHSMRRQAVLLCNRQRCR